MERLLALADGVFAIAITILVLDIRVPPDLAARELPVRVADLIPEFISYAISFVEIAFLPFPTLLLGEYWNRQISVTFYATDAAVARLLLVGIGWYASRGQHRLVSEDLDEERAGLRIAQGLAVPWVFLASIAISFWSTELATLSWLLLFLTDAAVGWAWRRARRL